MTLRAQVFISCGQREDLGEVEVADRLAAALAKAGFEPYVATKQQTLRGLKENIFERLAESEYFLFVDFRREQIAETEPALYRGSVFSQQELAVAAHLDIEVIAFQEEGVKLLEGILAFMQANCIRFRDRATLPVKVINVDLFGKRHETPLIRHFAPTSVPRVFRKNGCGSLWQRMAVHGSYFFLDKVFKGVQKRFKAYGKCIGFEV